MAELTPQDKENYENLKTAFLRRNSERDRDVTIERILETLEIDKSPKNIGELQQKIDALELYIKIKRDLLGIKLFIVKNPPIPPNPSSEEEKEKLEQVFLNSLEKLKGSLKVVEDETLNLTEEIEEKCPDRVILDFLEDSTFKEQTKALLNIKDRPPYLNKKQIERLIEAWGTAVSKFVEDARSGKDNGKVDPVDSAKPNTQKTLASFFCIHGKLETLYSRLADTKTVQKIF